MTLGLGATISVVSSDIPSSFKRLKVSERGERMVNTGCGRRGYISMLRFRHREMDGEYRDGTPFELYRSFQLLD